MKVVCIDDKNQICDIGCEDGLLIKGETYTMIDKGQMMRIDLLSFLGHDMYKLKETGYWHESKRFIPLDDYLEQFTGILTKELENINLIEI